MGFGKDFFRLFPSLRFSFYCAGDLSLILFCSEFLHSTRHNPILPRLLQLLNDSTTPQPVLAKTLDTLFRIVKFAPPTLHMTQHIRYPDCHDVVAEFVNCGGLDAVWSVFNTHRRSP